ncbi:MAG: NUDIX domain-containing protein [Candidatus Komeilibacteria bacterium]
MSDRRLNIVDEQDNIVGEETRDNIHKQGLLHREIHVWLVTPSREIIFQHRAKDKDTFPDLLDATVGGHVEIGDSYEAAAIREVQEEAGLNVTGTDLKLIKIARDQVYDPVTGTTNNTLRAIFAWLYPGKITDLKIESGKSLGFEAWSMVRLFALSAADKKKIVPSLVTDEYMLIYREIEKLLL